MGLDDYKVVLYRNHPDGWVAGSEHAEAGKPMPRDTAEIVHA